MIGTLKIDTSKANAMFRELAAKAGVPREDVMIAEVGKILEATVKNTDSASVSKINQRFDNASFSAQPESLYNPVNGRKGAATRDGKVRYYLQNRYPNALWAAIVDRRKKSLLAKLRARGLSKRSWMALARRLGVDISSPGYAARAVASTGKEYPEDTASTFKRQTGMLQINTFNSQPTVNATGGARAFQRAIDGRVKFFLANMALGTFNDAAKIASRYPGIKIAA